MGKSNGATKPTIGLDVDVPNFATSLVKWDGWNYLAWSQSMLSAMAAGGGEGYVGYLTGAKKKPISSDSAKWTQEDAFVRSYLIYNMTPDLASSLNSVPTAAGIWSSVKKMHLKGVNVRIFDLKKKIQEHKQEGMTLAQYYALLRCMYQELDAYQEEMYKDFDFVGGPELKKLQDKDRLYQFLMGLNGAYKNMAWEILWQDPLPSLEKAFQLVNQESNRQNPTTGSTPAFNPYSFAAHPQFPQGHPYSFPAHPSFPQGQTMNCDYCGELYHTRETCWKLQKKLPGPVVPHGQSVKCDHCGEFYHTRETCSKLHSKPPGSVDKGANGNDAISGGNDTEKAFKHINGRRGIAAEDPNKPKRPASAFFVFMEEFRVAFQKENPHNKSLAFVGKAGGAKWKSMSAAEKAPYQATANKRKAEYEKPLSSYNKKPSSGTPVETLSTSKEDKENGEDDDGEDDNSNKDEDYSSSEEEDEGAFVKIDMKDANGDGATPEGKDIKKAFKSTRVKFRVGFKKENPRNTSVSVVAKAGGDKRNSMSAAEQAQYQAKADKRIYPIKKAGRRKSDYDKSLIPYIEKPQCEHSSMVEDEDENEDHSSLEEADKKRKCTFINVDTDADPEEDDYDDDDYAG